MAQSGDDGETARINLRLPGQLKAGVEAAGRLLTALRRAVHELVGDIAMEHAAGHAEVTVGSGDLRFGDEEAGAVIKNSHGDTSVGAVGGDARLSAANGSTAVDVTKASVVAKSANGTFAWARPCSRPQRLPSRRPDRRCARTSGGNVVVHRPALSRG